MSLRRFLWLLMLCFPAARVGAAPAIVCGDQLLQRQRERNALLPAPKPLTRQQLLRSRRASSLSLAGSPAAPRTGDRVRLWALDFTAYDGRESSIKHYRLNAALKLVTDHAYIYVEDGIPASQRAINQLAGTFEAKILPLEHRYFGTPSTPGIDSDPRVTLLIANVRSPAAPADPLGLNAISIGGFFNDDDEYPNDDKHPFSNEREMVTLNANLDIGSPLQLEALAHEYQHLIHWHYDRGEELWVNEGLSMVAPAVVGVSRGPQSALGSAIMAFGLDYGHSLTQWSDPLSDKAGSLSAESVARAETGQDATLIHYGAAGLFFLYLQEKFGGPDTFARIVHHPEHGITGVLAGLSDAGHPVSFAALFTQWAVANLADIPAYGDPPHYYGYSSPEMHEIKASMNALHELLPDLIPRLFQPGTQIRSYPAAGSATLWPQTAHYLELTGTGNLTLTFDGAGHPFEAFVLARTSDGGYQLFPMPLDPQTRTGSVPVPALGSTITSAYLIVTNVSEEDTQPAEYRYEARLE